MRLFIEPTETLLFRTGHPFTAGENNFAQTLFPPTPETLQGAIRATIASYWDDKKTLAEAFQDKELVNLIGDRKHYARFRITCISLGRHKKDTKDNTVERIFPIPAHILQEDDGEKRQARLTPQTKAGVDSNLPDTMQMLYPDKEIKGKLEPMKGWLTERGLQKAFLTNENLLTKQYLRERKEDTDKAEVIEDSDIYTRESRLGIGMDSQRKATEEGLLYQVQMIRMNHQEKQQYVYGFVVDVRLSQSSEVSSTNPESLVDDAQTQQLLHLPDQGWMSLGGERRAAYFTVVKPPQGTSSAEVEQLQKGNLLYFATPAAFNKGWQPAEWLPPLKKPVAVAIDRYQSIGGWKLSPGSSGGLNKEMRRCVPAGSVYFFNEQIRVTQPLTDHGMQIGYGITYAGGEE